GRFHCRRAAAHPHRKALIRRIGPGGPMKLSKVEDSRNPAHLHRTLAREMVRVTERAAIAAAEWRGKGDEKAADEAAVAAMKAEFDRVAISGRIVIGEGEQYECDQLYVGQKVGTGTGPEVDI